MQGSWRCKEAGGAREEVFCSEVVGEDGRIASSQLVNIVANGGYRLAVCWPCAVGQEAYPGVEVSITKPSVRHLTCG